MLALLLKALAVKKKKLFQEMSPLLSHLSQNREIMKLKGDYLSDFDSPLVLLPQKLVLNSQYFQDFIFGLGHSLMKEIINGSVAFVFL